MTACVELLALDPSSEGCRHALDDRAIRDALIERFRVTVPRDKPCVLVHELCICEKQARVDVAVVDEILRAFEIKGAGDSLRRLPTQVENYCRVFDEATLVIAERHARSAMQVTPNWWGILVASLDSDGIRFTQIRDAQTNPHVDPRSLAQFLWRAEALEILESRNSARGVRSSGRDVLWSRLAEELTQGELRKEVTRRLRTRTAWRRALRLA